MWMVIVLMVLVGCSMSPQENTISKEAKIIGFQADIDKRLQNTTLLKNIWWNGDKFYIETPSNYSIYPGAIGLYQIRLSGKTTFIVLRLHSKYRENTKGYFPKSLDDIKEFGNMDDVYKFILKDHKPETIKTNSFESMEELVDYQKKD